MMYEPDLEVWEIQRVGAASGSCFGIEDNVGDAAPEDDYGVVAGRERFLCRS